MIKDESIHTPAPSESTVRRSAFLDSDAKPFIALAATAGLLFLIGEFIIAHTAPLENLFLSTKWSAVGTIHGVLGGVILIAGTIALYLSYRLLTGQLENFHDLQIAAVVATLAALATIVFGNWIYIGYRQAGMVQEYFLNNYPELHLIFFEFKENIALFTVPLAVPAVFILYRYGSDLGRHPWLRTMVFLLLVLFFLFMSIALGLGAAITKIKPV